MTDGSFARTLFIHFRNDLIHNRSTSLDDLEQRHTGVFMLKEIDHDENLYSAFPLTRKNVYGSQANGSDEREYVPCFLNPLDVEQYRQHVNLDAGREIETVLVPLEQAFFVASAFKQGLCINFGSDCRLWIPLARAQDYADHVVISGQPQDIFCPSPYTREVANALGINELSAQTIASEFEALQKIMSITLTSDIIDGKKCLLITGFVPENYGGDISDAVYRVFLEKVTNVNDIVLLDKLYDEVHLRTAHRDPIPLGPPSTDTRSLGKEHLR